MQSRYSASLLRHSLNLLLAYNRFFRKEAGYLPGTFIHRRSAIPLLLRLSIAVLAAGVPGIGGAVPCDPAWTQVAFHGPAAREFHAAAPLSSSSSILLFGGRDGIGALSDTWLRSDGSWTRLNPSASPNARWGHVMSPKTNNKVAVFGGRNNDGYYSDLWYWDGIWNGPYTPGPSARVNSAMAYDSARDRLVLFGGYAEGGALSDTWESRTANWLIWDKKTPTTSPPARSYHAMAYDPTRGTVLLFGGLTGSNQKLGDTWEWNGTTWTQVGVTGPTRYCHVMWFDSTRNRILIFGGIGPTGARLSDVQEWNGTSWIQVSAPAGPSARYGTAVAFDASTNRAVLVGGLDGTGVRSDTWTFDGASAQWSSLGVSSCGSRYQTSAAYDTVRDRVVVYGGVDAENGTFLWDTWEWNGIDWARAAKGGPTACHGTAMAYDSFRGVTVLYGGAWGSYQYSETWEWDGSAWTKRAVSGPGNRRNHALVYDSHRKVAVLFGGDPSANSGDTWEYNGTSWTQKSVTGPGGRFYHAMAYDSDRHVVVLFGGSSVSFTQYKNDTWEWDGTTWTLRATTGPTPRVYARMVYDTARKRMVLYGGSDETAKRTDSWEWNGSVWTQVGSNNPGYRSSGAGMVYDTARNQVVLVGGTVQTEWRNDTWVRNSPALIWFFGQPFSITRNVGQEATMAVSAFGSGTLQYRWRRNGSELTDGDGLTGTRSPTLRIASVRTTDAGTYDVRVFNECESVFSNSATLTVPINRDDSIRALRIAGGMITATADDRTRLDVLKGASAGKIDIGDAVQLLRTAVGL